MPQYSVDLIEWDGRYFCVLMEPYLFILEPYLRGDDEQGVDLLKVFSVDGHEVQADQYPAARITFCQTEVRRVWKDWDVRMEDSLLRHPAVRIYVDQDYETVRQARGVVDIVNRILDRKRAEKLDRIFEETKRRRDRGEYNT